MSTSYAQTEAYDLAQLENCLAQFFAETKVMYADVVTSTNDWGMHLPLSEKAKPEQAAADKPAATLIVAEQQTRGRGRLGRDWSSPAGGDIYMSLVLSGHFPIRAAGLLPLAMGLALQRALQPRLARALFLKWPNDLICENLKLAGILCEARLSGEQVRRFVIGLGLNVNRLNFPAELSQTACSLRQLQAQTSWSRTAIICDVLREFAELWPACLEHDPAFIPRYAASCYNLGKTVRARGVTGAVFEGVAVGLDEEGALLVRNEEGLVMPVRSGEVVLLL